MSSRKTTEGSKSRGCEILDNATPVPRDELGGDVEQCTSKGNQWTRNSTAMWSPWSSCVRKIPSSSPDRWFTIKLRVQLLPNTDVMMTTRFLYLLRFSSPGSFRCPLRPPVIPCYLLSVVYGSSWKHHWCHNYSSEGTRISVVVRLENTSRVHWRTGN